MAVCSTTAFPNWPKRDDKSWQFHSVAHVSPTSHNEEPEELEEPAVKERLPVEKLCSGLESYKIMSLEMRASGISDDGAQLLAAAFEINLSIKFVDLSANEITSVGAGYLAEALCVNTVIFSLNLGKNAIGSSGASALGRSLLQNKTLMKMNLSHCGIDSSGCQALARALSLRPPGNCQGKRFEMLNLAGHRLGAEGARAIMSIMHFVSGLQISSCGLGNQGAAFIAQGLVENRVLKQLVMAHNYIGSAGGTHLLEALKHNRVLEALVLDWNCLTDVRMNTISFLSSNSSLLTVSLQYCSLSDVQAEALGQSLSDNHKLRRLDLSGNAVGNHGACKLAVGVSMNSALQLLRLSENRFGEDGLVALRCGMASRAEVTGGGVTVLVDEDWTSKEYLLIRDMNRAQQGIADELNAFLQRGGKRKREEELLNMFPQVTSAPRDMLPIQMRNGHAVNIPDSHTNPQTQPFFFLTSGSEIQPHFNFQRLPQLQSPAPLADQSYCTSEMDNPSVPTQPSDIIFADNAIGTPRAVKLEREQKRRRCF